MDARVVDALGRIKGTGGGGGGISGPGTSTDRAIATWNGTGGATLRDNANATIDASGNLSVVSAKATGTAGAGFVEVVAQSSNAAAPAATGWRAFANATGMFAWAVKNGGDTFVRQFIGALTADRSYTLPDYDGQLATVAGTETLSNKILAQLHLIIGGFKAIFTHSNTVDRTYTLPDYDGTLATRAGTETLTNKTHTSPRIGTAILDTNGNEIARTPATASAVNDLTLRNAATGNPPSVEATGDDTNIDLLVQGKGTGAVKLGSDLNANDKPILNAGYIDLKAISSPANPSSGYERFFPDADNSNHMTRRNSSGAEVDLESAGGSGAMTQLVAWTVLGADTASVSMSSISGSYKHLILKIRVRTDHSAADDVLVRFNADTAAGNYFTAWGFGTSGSEGGNSNYGSVATITPVGGVVSANTATAGYYTTYEFLIMDYVSTSYFKCYNAFSTYAQSASSIFSLHIGGQWLDSANAINAISIAPRNGSNLKAGSAYGLWGIV